MDEHFLFDKSQLKSCGKNVIIGKTVRIRQPEKVEIGDNVIVDDFTYISGSVRLDDYVHVAPNCVLSASSGQIHMLPFSGLSAGCKVYAASSNYLNIGLDIPTIPEKYRYNTIIENTILESFVIVGANSVILPGVKIPQGCTVAAAIVVRKNTGLKAWHCLIDQQGKLLPRRGLAELRNRIAEFYDIEITKD